MKLKRTMLLVVALFVIPLAISVATHTPTAATWQTATREPTGLSPDPATFGGPVVQVYSARTFGWRGAFGVPRWIIFKREGAPAYTRYDVLSGAARRTSARTSPAPTPSGSAPAPTSSSTGAARASTSSSTRSRPP